MPNPEKEKRKAEGYVRLRQKVETLDINRAGVEIITDAVNYAIGIQERKLEQRVLENIEYERGYYAALKHVNNIVPRLRADYEKSTKEA